MVGKFNTFAPLPLHCYKVKHSLVSSVEDESLTKAEQDKIAMPPPASISCSQTSITASTSGECLTIYFTYSFTTCLLTKNTPCLGFVLFFGSILYA